MIRACIVTPYPMREDAPVVWYCVPISEVLVTLLVAPLMRLRPCTDKVRPPEKRRSDFGAGADDDDADDDDAPVLGGEAGAGLCGAAGCAL